LVSNSSPAPPAWWASSVRRGALADNLVLELGAAT
jgi:hypothetical protein